MPGQAETLLPARPNRRWLFSRAAPRYSSNMRGLGGRRRTLPWIAGLLVVASGAVAVAVALIPRGQQELPDDSVALARPLPGEVRADYLPDGTPVWVTGHADGDASVISAFSSHVPYGLNKLVWWCAKADAFDDPSHGGKWDEYGVRFGGPAPIGLATYETAMVGRSGRHRRPSRGPTSGHAVPGSRRNGTRMVPRPRRWGDVAYVRRLANLGLAHGRCGREARGVDPAGRSSDCRRRRDATLRCGRLR